MTPSNTRKRRQYAVFCVVVLIIFTLVLHPGLDWGLIRASRDGDLGAVNRLLSVGADANSGHAIPGYALVQSADFGHADIVKVLLAAGADPNSRVEGGESALIFAAENGHVAVVRELLEARADPNRTDGGGNTPLKYAKGHEDVIALLVKAGAK